MFGSMTEVVAYDLEGKKKELVGQGLSKTVPVVKESLEKLFKGNQNKLINLVSYDAHSLFFEAPTEAKAMAPAGDSFEYSVDLVVDNTNQDNNNYIIGQATQRFLDRDASDNSIYYGSLSVTYGSQGISYTRRFAFDSDDKLVITNSIGDLEFYEEVTLNEEGTLQYEVFKYIPVYKDGKPLIDEFGRKVYEQLKDENGTPVFDKNGSPVYKRDIILKADENTLDEVVNNYVVANNAEEFKLFFPEVYSKDFFKDYSNIR